MPAGTVFLGIIGDGRTAEVENRMLANKLKSAFAATASVAALVVGLGTSPAGAVPVFTINPNVLTTGTAVPNVVVSDFQGSSDALVQLTSPTTAIETGWVQGLFFQNNGVPVASGASLMTPEGSLGCVPSCTFAYNLYLTFTAAISGLTAGLGAGTVGNLALPGDFSATLFADITNNDIFNAPRSHGTDAGVTEKK